MITIDRLKKEYLEDLVVLEKLCFSVPWSYESFEKELQNEVAHYFVALDDGLTIGYIGLWCVLEEASITNIAVHPKYQNQKIGSKLLQTAIEFCIGQKVDYIMLEVRESNKIAQKLYKKFGFDQISIRKQYYRNPTENAMIFKKYVELE